MKLAMMTVSALGAAAPITPMWFQVTKNLVDPSLTGWEENAQDQHRSRFLCRAEASEG